MISLFRLFFVKLLFSKIVRSLTNAMLCEECIQREVLIIQRKPFPEDFYKGTDRIKPICVAIQNNHSLCLKRVFFDAYVDIRKELDYLDEICIIKLNALKYGNIDVLLKISISSFDFSFFCESRSFRLQHRLAHNDFAIFKRFIACDPTMKQPCYMLEYVQKLFENSMYDCFLYVFSDEFFKYFKVLNCIDLCDMLELTNLTKIETIVSCCYEMRSFFIDTLLPNIKGIQKLQDTYSLITQYKDMLNIQKSYTSNSCQSLPQDVVTNCILPYI